jgi:hypothetical protein
MSLPTATLGQLPTMSMPYSIPTYEKPPSIWEKALASFLVNAAGSVAQQAGHNVMSKDNSAEFGEKPATWFQHLMGGGVSDEEARQRRQNTFTGERDDKQLAEQRAQAEYGRSHASSESLFNRTHSSEEAALNRDAAAAQSTRAGALELIRQQQGASDTAFQDTINDKRTMLNAFLKARLERENPESQARTGLYSAEADKYRTENELNAFNLKRQLELRQGLHGGAAPALSLIHI